MSWVCPVVVISTILLLETDYMDETSRFTRNSIYIILACFCVQNLFSIKIFFTKKVSQAKTFA